MRVTALLAIVLTISASAQERGVFTADIDRNVDSCTNFYDYANGAWRAANPIPPSMNRWSRRWASGVRGDAIRPETQRMMVQGDPHPTGQYRVVGPLSNMPELARAFGCKADALMVRPASARCEVW